MLGVFLLIIALLGETTAQLTFDVMERPLTEIAKPLLQPSSRPLLVVEQRPIDSSGLPANLIFLNPRPIPSSSALPPQSSQSPPQSPPHHPLPTVPKQTVLQQVVPSDMLTAHSSNLPLPRQPTQSDRSPRIPFRLEFLRQPQPSNSPLRTVLAPSSLGILNRDRIRVEGFQPIHRRFASTRNKRSPVIIDDLSSFGENTKDEEFLPVEPSGRNISAVELFDRSESKVVNGTGSEDVDGFRNVSRSDYISSRNLRPESGYQASATRVSNESLKFKNMSSNVISRMQQERAEEESNSILNQEGGSGFGGDTDMSKNEENVIETSSPVSFLPAVELSGEREELTPIKFETPEEPQISDMTTVSTRNVTSFTVHEPPMVKLKLPSTRATEGFLFPTGSPNSVPFVRDSKMLRIVKEYAGLIVGCILGIPAVVVLCYFLYLKRLKRYTGTMDVSPSQRACHRKKSESRKTICSEENELACSPSTSPQPPPFPNCKKYVP